MPFGMKNAKATYHSLVNRVFEAQIGRNMEVYVDNMIVKRCKIDSHVVGLEEIIITPKKYNMKLNPKKCSFRVQSRRFLGYVVE